VNEKASTDPLRLRQSVWPTRMDPFSYVCILTSIVAGLAMTRLVGGIGQLLQTRKRTPTYWVHSLWMGNVLMTVIIAWWVQYRWRNIEQWTLFLVLWLLVAPIQQSAAPDVSDHPAGSAVGFSVTEL
jgi:hypothetical protein